MEIFVISIIILGILGFAFAGLLGLAADYFKVETDPKVDAIIAILPGANCGACGAAGCHNFAERVAKGEIAISGCVVGGKEVVEKIGAIMGIEVPSDLHKQVAAVHCGAKANARKMIARYQGVAKCSAAQQLRGGGTACGYGCLGYGDCFCVCPFGAITMVDGLPKIDPDKCTACGQCVSACPRKIITLVPHDFGAVIACSSKDGGAVVRKVCPVGCIGCKICEKAVPEVYKVVDNLAIIDYNIKGVDPAPAIAKCPTKCIVK
ncbi:MAG: RnfABCDGE type electron transport complex subunit B [Candidatus Margulisbacteria bacterium]|nr:RnfABCDGE type electron transport complex subunit B [Candidatus Margulisiibacteriota bacterium]MBU1617551.1 RnfABCDGE type electron transport complex subunit B [Candidatus Margulisiibacteriota bacterium]MBU1867210.1 RnfABCDGE type electron transport complex subunit B [Candidatus Margulisiibacteriota bacterium]